jgi:cytochrome c oxidase cbb3-type subunit 2
MLFVSAKGGLMNSGPVLFVGLLAAMACSWTGFVLGPQMQLGDISQTNTVPIGDTLPLTYPVAQPGEAHAGAEVYRANGCAACHTEMVRPNPAVYAVGFGSDIHRGWGARRSLAEDYLFEQPVMLGTQRIGPDLANFGRRAVTNYIYVHLYNPRSITPGSLMPPYRFLFETRKIGLTRSEDALDLQGDDAPPPGYEVVPRRQAKALAQYLLNLRQEGYLYEAPPPPQLQVKTNSAATNAAAAAAKPAPKLK